MPKLISGLVYITIGLTSFKIARKYSESGVSCIKSYLILFGPGGVA
jgi:hypothetical protein